MREIKFRAWHKVGKKMFSAEEMGKDQLTISPDGRGFINVHGSITKLSHYITDMIPMQYTGLKDKNDVEIYEGDILSVNKNNKNYVEEIDEKRNIRIGDTGEVYYSSCHYAISLNSGFFDLQELISHQENMCAEIIGNIYENPELIK